MYKVTVEDNFCASHVLPSHDKCSKLHGHNYRVLVTCGRQELFGGMVIDFGLVKAQLKELLNKFDHRFIIPILNPNFGVVINEEQHVLTVSVSRDKMNPLLITGTETEFVQLKIEQSTAECIAGYVQEQMEQYFSNVSVIVYETPTSYTEV